MQVALSPACSGPGSLLMQSTGQTAMQTSQPVQLSGLMTALGRPLRGGALVTAIDARPFMDFQKMMLYSCQEHPFLCHPFLNIHLCQVRCNE